jgi:hypothetical protein
LSFDLVLQDLRNGRKEGVRLSPEHAAALQDVVSSYGGPAAPDDHGYFFESEKAGSIELYAGRDRPRGMLALRGWSAGKADFVFDLIEKTGWSAAIGSDPMLVMAAHEFSATERDTLNDVEVDFKRVLGGADVFNAMQSAFDGWTNYRDQIVKGQD